MPLVRCTSSQSSVWSSVDTAAARSPNTTRASPAGAAMAPMGPSPRSDEQHGQRVAHEPAGHHPPPRVAGLAEHLGREVGEERDADEGGGVALGDEHQEQPDHEVGEGDADAQERGRRARSAAAPAAVR